MMQQKTQLQAVYSHGSQYKRFGELEQCPSGSWEPQVAAQAFVGAVHGMPTIALKRRQRRMLKRAQTTPAHEWARVQLHKRVNRWMSQSSGKKK